MFTPPHADPHADLPKTHDAFGPDIGSLAYGDRILGQLASPPGGAPAPTPLVDAFLALSFICWGVPEGGLLALGCFFMRLFWRITVVRMLRWILRQLDQWLMRAEMHRARDASDWLMTANRDFAAARRSCQSSGTASWYAVPSVHMLMGRNVDDVSQRGRIPC